MADSEQIQPPTSAQESPRLRSAHSSIEGPTQGTLSESTMAGAQTVQSGPLKGEPIFALPVAQIVGLFVLMLILSVLTLMLPWESWQAPPESARGLLASSSAITILWAVIFFGMQPWKRRPASEWILWWLGSTVVRVLGAPILLISIYFFSHLPALAVLVGGVVWAIVGLLAEAMIVAKSVSRQTASTQKP
ncbi:MAG: hypothetical protein EXS12_07350 [Phycisphaerales bacterium]|nr:hypothetical protein [Phycisphaerales bacterium]